MSTLNTASTSTRNMRTMYEAISRQQHHGEVGHLNIYVRDHDSYVTGFGIHDRVVACKPILGGLLVTVDHKWKLGEPTVEQVLTVALNAELITTRNWAVHSVEQYNDGRKTQYIFHEIGRTRSVAAN